MGRTQRKGNIYYAVIPVNSKAKWVRGGPPENELEKALAARIAKIDPDLHKDLPEIKFRKFAKLWLKTYALAHVKPSTYASYRAIVNGLLTPEWGNRSISDLTTGHLQIYVSDRLKSVSPKTVSNEIVVIKEMFKHAHRWGYIRNNPAEHLERPKVKKAEIEVLAPEEVKQLLLNTASHYQIAFLACVLTGMRAGELWGLHWTEVDWSAQQIFVKQSLWRGQFQDPKSSYSIRKIDIPDLLLHELRKWKNASPESPLVFPSPEGKPSCHNNVVKRFFNPALEKAKLRHASFHSLRHTNASMRIAAGQNIKYIQKQLGHASIKMTLDIYGHLFNDVNFSRQQVKLLDSSLSPVMESLGRKGLPAPGAVAGKEKHLLGQAGYG